MQRRERAYLSFPTFTFGMKHSSCLLPSTFLQCWALHLLQALCLASPWFNVELSTFFKPCVLRLLETMCYSRSRALSRWSEREMRWER
jgi:hypothetical protein